MSRLENIARSAMGGDSIMDGREKIKTDDIVQLYPNGICITGVAKNNYNGSTYPVLTFAEDPSKYFSGATAISQLVDGMLEGYDGDLAALNSDLQKEYLKIKLVKTKTKRGYNFTKVIVVGVVPATPATVTDENGVEVDTETGEVINAEGEYDGQQNFSVESNELPF